MKWLAERYLKLRGWKFIGSLPDTDKFVIIGAPHTTNWDFVVYLAAIRHWDMTPRYLGKHTLFEGPFGWLFRKWGGIAVNRNQAGGVIKKVTEEFARSRRLALVIAPEGTRKGADNWKSGFLTIAAATAVPIVPAAVDVENKRVTLGTAIEHGGDIEATMDRIRAFYASAVDSWPGPLESIHVREEDDRAL